LRHLAFEFRQPLGHHLPRAEDVAAILENGRDYRESCADCDLMDSRFATPLTAFSTGRVTRASTSSGESPGASVWITTSGGAKSG